MGGHHSTQSMSATTDLVTNAIMDQTQSCIGITNGTNSITIDGDSNELSGITQDLSFSISQSCANTLTSQADFQSKVANSIAQKLSDQDVAMTSWLSPGKSSQSASIKTTATTNISSDIVQKCLASLSGQNIINVRGSGNLLQNIAQKQAQTMVGTCMQNSQQSMQTMADITNTVNQQLSHVSKNPFAFITDAIQSVVQNLALALGVCVAAVVLVYVLHKALHKPAAYSVPVYRPAPPGLPAAV